MAPFSSKGPVVWQGVDLKKPDVVAPGVNICAAELFGLVYPNYKCLDQNHVYLSGTSMATPHVSGLAALAIQANPDWNPQKVKQAIKESAENINKDYNSQGAGVIDAKKLFNIQDAITPPPGNQPKKMNLSPIKDAYVSQNNTNANFGSVNTLRVDGAPRQISYLAFNLKNLNGKKIVSAKLLLTVGQVGKSIKSQNFNLRHVGQQDWQEKKITYNKRPEIGSGNLATFKGRSTGTVIELDVKTVVEKYKGKKETFAIVTAGKDPLILRSSDASSGKPKLIVEYE